MPSVYRTTAIWSGFTGAPGYTKLSWQDLIDSSSRNAAGAKFRAFFQALSGFFQNGWTIQFSTEIQEFDMATGALLGAANMTTPPANVVGSGGASTSYVGGSGACITWNTGLIIARRRVRGRTFIVPMVSQADVNGTLSSTAMTALTTAADGLIALTAPRPNVWSRQWSSGAPPVQIGGSIAPIDSYTLKDQASQLRTRRL